LPSGSISNPEPTNVTIANLRRVLDLLLQVVEHVCLTGTPQTWKYQVDGSGAKVEFENGVTIPLMNPYQRAVELNEAVEKWVVPEYRGKVRFHDITPLMSEKRIDEFGHVQIFPEKRNFVYGEMLGTKMVDNRDHYSARGFQQMFEHVLPMMEECGAGTNLSMRYEDNLTGN